MAGLVPMYTEKGALLVNREYVAKTAAFTVNYDDRSKLFGLNNATGFAVTLPAGSAGLGGFYVEFVILVGGAHTLTAGGSDTITPDSGATAAATLVLVAGGVGDRYLVCSVGTSTWYCYRTPAVGPSRVDLANPGVRDVTGGAQTITAAELVGGYTYDGAAGAAVALTLPTAALIQTALLAKGITSADGLRLPPILVNVTDAFVVTVTLGVGGTVQGKATIDGGNGMVFVVFTSATTYDAYVYEAGQKSSSTSAIALAATLTAADSGSCFSVAKTSVYTITLPTPRQGLMFKFFALDTGANIVTITDGAAHLYGTVDVAGTPVIMTGTNILLASGSGIGDWVQFDGVDATHYLVSGACVGALDITVS